MDEDLKFLKELQKELKTQEVDGQAAPRYWVVMDYEWKVTANGYHDRVSVYDPNEGEAYEIKDAILKELTKALSLANPDIDTLELSVDMEHVQIRYKNGYRRAACIAGDSKIAMIVDVAKTAMR